jgi:hypothetical protein
MNNDNEKESTSFKDKMMSLYGVGVLGFASYTYSVDGFWVALGKAMIWPIRLGVYLIDKFA